MNDSLLIAAIVDACFGPRREAHALFGRWRKRVLIRIQWLEEKLKDGLPHHASAQELAALNGILDESKAQRQDTRRLHTVLVAALLLLSPAQLEAVLQEARRIAALTPSELQRDPRKLCSHCGTDPDMQRDE